MMSLPCPIRDLIPQKGKMGFDENLIKVESKNGEGSALIKEDNIFLNFNKELSNIALIEFVNQLAAAVQGYNEKSNNKKPVKGLFVGVQEAEFFQTVKSGDLLTLTGSVTEEVAQVTFLEGIIERDGERITRLITKLYEVSGLSEFESLMSRERHELEKKVVLLNKNEPPACLSSDMRRKLYSYMQGTEIGNDYISFKISCPEDFEAFDGHFPGNPLLPGIMLLEIGNLALEIFINSPFVINYIKKMKIAGIVFPGQAVSCNIKIDSRDESKLAFSALLKGEDGREISHYSGFGKVYG